MRPASGCSTATTPAAGRRFRIGPRRRIGTRVVLPYASIKDWLSDKSKTGRVTRVKLGSYVLVKPDRRG